MMTPETVVPALVCMEPQSEVVVSLSPDCLATPAMCMPTSLSLRQALQACPWWTGVFCTVNELEQVQLIQVRSGGQAGLLEDQPRAP